MSTIKNVKLEYYRCNLVEEGNMETIDLEKMFEDLYFKLERGHVIRYEFNNEIAKLANVDYYPEIGSYHLCFERLRDFNIPVKSSFQRESETIDLEEDEYIGEEVSLLYDTTNRVCILQRNRDSLSPTALEFFINDIYSSFVGMEVNLELNPIIESDTLQYILGSNQIRKINVRVDDLGQETNYEDDLSNITDEVTRFEAASLDFTLSVGREKEKEMEPSAARKLINSLVGRKNINKAQVYIREEKNSNVEKYDLIEHKIYSIITFDYKENKTIRPDAIFLKMRDAYFGDNYDGMKSRIQRM